ncbi:hypothetical protein C8F01DRAFT_1256796 [Mycena amicta]|nr:hypothetical protein C8F01DRAFT_1256796 [Mycena amicta]
MLILCRVTPTALPFRRATPILSDLSHAEAFILIPSCALAEPSCLAPRVLIHVPSYAPALISPLSHALGVSYFVLWALIIILRFGCLLAAFLLWALVISLIGCLCFGHSSSSYSSGVCASGTRPHSRLTLRASRASGTRRAFVLRALVLVSLIGCLCFGHSSSSLLLGVCASGTRPRSGLRVSVWCYASGVHPILHFKLSQPWSLVQ